MIFCGNIVRVRNDQYFDADPDGACHSFKGLGEEFRFSAIRNNNARRCMALNFMLPSDLTGFLSSRTI